VSVMLTTDTPTASLDSAFDTTFTWDYDRGRDGLDRLYEKAKVNQWNSTTDLDWSIDVDPEKDIAVGAADMGVPVGWQARRLAALDGSPIASWGEREFLDFAIENQKASMSQFLHGEQGALLCTSRLVESVPERQEFCYAAIDHMRRRTINEEMWEALGVDTEWIMNTVLSMPIQKELQGILFAKIVPNCKKLGLLDAGDGWLRTKFEEIDIIRFEDEPAGDEILSLPDIKV
jgi:hypothetical protein